MAEEPGAGGLTPEAPGGPAAAGCAMTPAPAVNATSITFVSGGALRELTADQATAACLHALAADEVVLDDPGAEPRAPLWAPDGTRVLLTSARMLDANNVVHDTGYFPENRKVAWSMPTGTSLIAPAVRDGSLIKRVAGNAGSRLDVTFVTPTEAAAYHPAGKHIFASGDGPEGPGLYIASNIGKQPKMIAQLTEADGKITEIAAQLSGDWVAFIHDHGTYRHVHRLHLPDLALSDVIVTDAPLSKLTMSSGGRLAMRAGSCDATDTASTGGHTTTVVAGEPTTANTAGNTAGTASGGDDANTGANASSATTTLDKGPLAGLSTAPVGWVDDTHLLVAARAAGCTGAQDGYVVDVTNPTDVRPVLVGVDAIAVRGHVGEVGELPGEIEAQAPG